MKKTFFLIGALGLLLTTGTAAGSDRTWTETTWDSADDIKNVNFGKDNKLIIQLGTDGTEVDLGGIGLSNGVIYEHTDPETGAKSGAINNENTPPDNEDASPRTYTYGALELGENATVKLSKNTSGAKYTTVGTLSLKSDASFTLEDRLLEVTGLPYVSLESGAKIILSTSTGEGTSAGTLSMGSASVTGENSVVVKGVNGGKGIITNTSNSIAELGGTNAANVEYQDVHIAVNGTQEETTIVAKLGNAAIQNNTSNKEVIISGGVATGYTTAVTQLSTGYSETSGGNITLLNRGTDNLKMDSVFIGTNLTVAAKQENRNSTSAVIEINAYDSGTYDIGGFTSLPGLIILGEGAALDADLVLGTGYTDEVVFFQNGAALDMVGNDVTLQAGIMMYGYRTEVSEDSPEVLLFSNVDSLTLGRNVYNDRYFDEQAQIAACNFFSSNYEDEFGLMASVDELVEDEDGNLTGWFMEYRDNQKGNGTGDVYMVYRTVAPIPEPTTATLSLLALAGLAARRRRR